MKKTILLLLIAFTAVSCTSSDSSEPVPITPDALSIDGVPVEILARTSDLVYGNYYELEVATANPSRSVIIRFDRYGHFVLANVNNAGQMHSSENYPYFRSHYFDFSMTPVNNDQFAVDFSGTVYADSLDMNSVPTTISGHFTLNYMPYVSQGDWFDYRGIYAQVDGQDWYSPMGDAHPDDGTYFNSYIYGADAYRLVFNASGAETPNGHYDFTASSIHNCIKVEKFNTATMSYETWLTQGAFDITDRSEPFQDEWYLKGTFALTATNPANPSETVHFGNGVFDALNL
jgi:hypothetical protein